MENYIKEKIKELEILNQTPFENEYWKGKVDAYQDVLEQLSISHVVVPKGTLCECDGPIKTHINYKGRVVCDDCHNPLLA